MGRTCNARLVLVDVNGVLMGFYTVTAGAGGGRLFVGPAVDLYPMEHEIGPGVQDGIFCGKAEAVGAGGEYVQLGGHAELVARFKEEEGVFDGYGFIGGGMYEKNGWGIFRDAFFSGECLPHFFVGADEGGAGAFVHVFFVGQRDDRIEEDREVRAGAETVDGVGGVGAGCIGLGGE